MTFVDAFATSTIRRHPLTYCRQPLFSLLWCLSLLLLATLRLSSTSVAASILAEILPESPRGIHPVLAQPAVIDNPNSAETPHFTDIAAGYTHTCGLVAGGEAKCWGWNGFGQLGNGTTEDSSTPVDVSGLTRGVTAIAVGWYHTCALLSGGGVKCWGENEYGQLGDNSTTDRPTPVDVFGLENGSMAIAAGGSHTCSLGVEGTAKCWGSNEYSPLSIGTAEERGLPMGMAGLTNDVTAIAVGGFHTCALLSSGGVKCWGENEYGQLGNGMTVDSRKPVDVAGLTSGVTAIAVGWYHTCALLSGGGVKCWGWNDAGQLGDNSTADHHTPVDVVGLTSGVKAIAAGGFHTCALLSIGGAKCWGENIDGQLGNGTNDGSSSPVDVVGLGGSAMAIAAGEEHTCAEVWKNSNAGMKCWGWNEYGQLGDGTTNSSSTPVDVAGLASGAATIAPGYSHTCALLSGGVAKCWGDNEFGQLGDGTTNSSNKPVDVIGLAGGAAAIALVPVTPGHYVTSFIQVPAGFFWGSGGQRSTASP